MRVPVCWVLLLCSLAVGGCARKKSTGELVEDLKSNQAHERVSAVRLLPQQKGDPAQVVPALTEALKDRDSEVRRGAALGLGSYGEQAKDAIPALRAARSDRDPRVREAAGIALSRIEPDAPPK
jgi:HEAT repeat protein